MPERIRLADSSLWVEPEGERDEIVAGWGGSMRDGLGVRAERSGVEVAITGGVLLDPVLGVRHASIGISGGRVVSVGRAGNPDTMDGIDVVLDTATAVHDATGLLVTPGGVDTHVHWLSPQVADAALAGGLTTLVIQDPGPVWNLGCNPPELVRAAWAALDAYPLNAALLVRASSSRPEPILDALRAGGAGLKIHEDVAAGPDQIRCALDVADGEDVQLAIHTDGLNEALSLEDTYGAFGGRTVHAFHIEGCGGGHAPDLLALAGRARVLTSSTNPSVPFGAAADQEGRAMVEAVHVADPRGRSGDREIIAARVRRQTMAAEGVLHDLGVLHMLSSDSQGMGRAGEVVRRALQNADWMRRVRGSQDLHDNERVLRHLAKVTINPALAHGLAGHVGALTPGRLADAVLWDPALIGVRPALVLKAGMAAWGASGDGNAATMTCEPVRVGPQIGALGGAPARISLAFLAGSAMDADLPTARERARVQGCRDLSAADMVRNTRTGEVRVDPRTLAVSFEGEPVEAPPVEDLAFSGTFLLG